MKNIIEFTIKNLSLRIEKASFALEWKTMQSAHETGAKKKELLDSVAVLKDNVAGYKKVQKLLNGNKNLSKKDVEYILKSLKIRLRILNENLADCKKLVKEEEYALKTKENKTMNAGGFGVTIVHYDDISISIIESTKKRIEKISKSKVLCEGAIEFFEGYLK